MAAPNTNWNLFVAFDDTAILNRTIFNTEDIQTSRNRFLTWTKSLRDGMNTQPHHCGIPAGRIPDVTNLLNAFFPLVGPCVFPISFLTPGNKEDGAQLVKPVKIKHTAGPPIALDPVNVTFGASNFDIVDGPAALGYIFSISQPQAVVPAVVRTYETYGLPLLAVYSRCLFLAYCVKPGEIDQVTPDNVPWMSNIMYITGSNSFVCILGSTYITSDPGATEDDLGKTLTHLMNNWRRVQIMDRGLTYYDQVRHLPSIPPKLSQAIARAVYKAFRGFSIAKPNVTVNRFDANGEVTPAVAYDFQPVVSEVDTELFFNARKDKFVEMLSVDAECQPWNQLVGNRLFQPQITALALAIVNARWDLDYVRDGPAITTACKALFRFYFIPHFFPRLIDKKKPGLREPNLHKPEIVAPPGFNDAVAECLETLWNDNRAKMQDLLDQIYRWLNSGENLLNLEGDPPLYGRCAETYPVTGLLPHWTPSRVLPTTNVPQGHDSVSVVRGFSFKNRRFNNVNTPATNIGMLAEDFRSTTLNSCHSTTAIYRLPCDNCKSMMPIYDVPLGQAHYYADLYQIDPVNAPNVE